MTPTRPLRQYFQTRVHSNPRTNQTTLPSLEKKKKKKGRNKLDPATIHRSPRPIETTQLPIRDSSPEKVSRERRRLLDVKAAGG